MDAMPVTNIKAKWSSGNLVYTDNSGTELLSIESDGTVDIKIADKLKVAGVALASPAESLYLDGITPGTVTASKAVVVDADKHIDTIVIADGGLKLGATTGTAVTSTAAEINLLDGSVAGTSVASKAAVLGANKNLDVLVIADGGLSLGAGAGTAITATAAEINLIDGSIAGTAVASKVLSLGATKNIDTLVIADGGLYLGAVAGTAVTSTAVEINKLAGVTGGTTAASKALVVDANSAISNIALPVSGLKIGAAAGTAVDCTAAELNVLNGVTAGTTTASKALVVDANSALTALALPVSGLKIGAGAGTSVTANAAELNTMTGITSTTAELNEYFVQAKFTDAGTAGSIFVVAPHAGSIIGLYAVNDVNNATTKTVLTAEIAGVLVTAPAWEITITQAAGTVSSSVPTATNVVTAGQAIEIISDGGTDATMPASCTIVISR
jgi:cytoskeletal protein CcmA (bactofilin family)